MTGAVWMVGMLVAAIGAFVAYDEYVAWHDRRRRRRGAA